ncbi:MAG: phage tail tape measure protein [Promethearchaeota archaeon]
MANEKHNLGVGFDADITALNKKLDTISNNIQRISQSFQQLEQKSKNIQNVTSSLSQQNQQADKNVRSIKRMNTEANKFVKTSSDMKQGVEQASEGIKKQKDETKDADKATKNWLSSYSESTAIAIKSTAIWGAATTAIYGTKQAFQETHQIIMDVNTEMVALRRVMDESTTNFDEIQQSAAELGVEYANSVSEVVESMVQWGRQGREQVEVLELTEAALLATNVAQMDAKESVDLLTAAILQFNMQASEATSVVDRLNATANNYATTASDLAMSIRESGAAANNAGISMDELIGMTTSLQAATAKTGNRIGRSLRTTFSRMMGDMQASGESLGKVEDALDSVGISLRKDEDTYRNMTDVLTDLAVRWEDLDEVTQANIARMMGGRRRYSDVISLIENWDMALDATETSMNSMNSALEENETYMESMQAKWQAMQSRLQQLALTVGELGGKSLSKDLADGLLDTVANIENLIVGSSELVRIIKENKAVVNSLATAIAYSLLPAIKSLIPVIRSWVASNPVTLIAGTLVPMITTAIAKFGEYREQIEEAQKAHKDFNSVMEKSNELSTEELESTEEKIEKYENLVEKYIDLSSNFPDDDPSLPKIGMTSGQVNQARESEKALKKLENAFPELAEEAESTSEFLDMVTDKMYKMEDAIENSVSWIEKQSRRQYEQYS